MSRIELNLARRPFLDTRHLDAVLAVVGLAVLLLLWLNLGSWLRERAEGAGAERLEAQRQEVARLQGEIRAATEAADRARTAYSEREIESINGLIAQRTFSWVEMLAHLERALPDDVVLRMITPTLGEDLAEIDLGITGISRSREGALQLIENLFQEPVFRNPMPRRISDQEATGNPDGMEFGLSVTYLANRALAQRFQSFEDAADTEETELVEPQEQVVDDEPNGGEGR